MMRKLIVAIVVTAVAALSSVAGATDIKQGAAEAKGKTVETYDKAKTGAGDAARTVEKKTVQTYEKGKGYTKRTTAKVKSTVEKK